MTVVKMENISVILVELRQNSSRFRTLNVCIYIFLLIVVYTFCNCSTTLQILLQHICDGPIHRDTEVERTFISSLSFFLHVHK